MTYLISNPSTSFKTRQRAEKMWSKGIAPFPAVAGVVAWAGSIYQFVVPSNIGLSLGLAGTGTAAGGVSGWYYSRFAQNKQMKFVPYENNDNLTRMEWSGMLEAIFSIEEELYNYLKTLDKDNFAYDTAREAWKNVADVQWDALTLYDRMIPYLTNVRATTTDILKEELRKMAMWRDQCQLISDGVLHLGIRSEMFTTTADKSHLDVLVRELKTMCSSLDELSQNSARQLGAVSEDDEFKERYMDQETHKVRSA